MKVFLFAALILSVKLYGQSAEDFPVEEAKRILSFLASDSLKGRGNGTMELHKAAYFIEKEFKKDSLHHFPGFNSYLQPFSLLPLSEREQHVDTSGRFLSSKIMFNVVGLLPGNKFPEQVIVFSAHYDHVGTASSGSDYIFNGANDNASGTTALLMLAHYYAQQKNNARTLVFCAFAGEELGLEGSNVFVNMINSKNVVAGINIEMIGSTSLSGKNAFFITGESLSNLGQILRKNLKGTPFRVVRKYDEKMLFQRSDNYSFAAEGIPAHTIMCSDDDDPCYHKVCDEVRRIDMANMVKVIRAIALASRTLVDGTDNPTRIKLKGVTK